MNPFFTILWLPLLLLLPGCTAAPAWEGPRTAHFDGTHFANSEPMDKSAWDMLKLGWGALTQAEEWPKAVPVQRQIIARERVHDDLSVTFINHATFLIQVGGLNILTDPVYADRASPFSWVGPKRVHEPGVPFAHLPPIDVILISHNHYDHLDVDTLQALYRRQSEPPLLLAGLGNGALFEQLGLGNYRDLDWGETVELGGSRFVFTECRHRSGRGLLDQMRTLWGSFAIETPMGNVYFAGDTGYGPHLRETGDQYGPFALALLPIGAYEPRWFMADVHLDPEEAVRAHLDLRSRYSIGMHFGTFQLTYEGIDQPLSDLRAALELHDVPESSFEVLAPGQTTIVRSGLTTAALN